MGKTASLALLAIKYATSSTEMNDFDFVFTIRLRAVDEESSLPELIVKQHCKLKDHHVGFIQSILLGKTDHKVALLLDGYDEYKKGTNCEVDEAIESGIGNTFLMLTSRPGYLSNKTINKMDGQVTITGFSRSNIWKCAELYLESKERAKEVIHQAEKVGIYQFLHVPIMLLMVCVIFDHQGTLPKTKTDTVCTIIELTIDRTTMKRFGCKSSYVRDIDRLLSVLAEFSWKALQKDHGQLLLIKVSKVITL